MATPNKQTGIVCEMDAHISGPTKKLIGGYASSLNINGTAVNPSLNSKVKSLQSPITCSAFLTLIRPINETVLQVQMGLDRNESKSGGTQPSGLLSHLIGKEATQITVNASLEAWQTSPSKAVLQSVTITGLIHVLRNGQFDLAYLGPWETETHQLECFQVGLVPQSTTILQVNFGGQQNDVWPISPAVA
jgi:hypothetical protein